MKSSLHSSLLLPAPPAGFHPRASAAPFFTTHPRGSLRASSSKPREAEDIPITFAEIQDIAKRRGVYLGASEIGPVFQLVMRDLQGAEPGPRAASVDDDDPSVLGIVKGFTVAPLGLLHLDTMRVFNRRIHGQGGAERASRIRKSILGLGFLLGAASLAYGHDKGCKKGELLAINDDDDQHDQLVKFYARFGWRAVREVDGSSLSDLPHMLVWGGAGTRMDIDIGMMVRSRWVRALRASGLETVAPAAASPTSAEQVHEA